jgi:flagellar biosynthetic protein FliO
MILMSLFKKNFILLILILCNSTGLSWAQADKEKNIIPILANSKNQVQNNQSTGMDNNLSTGQLFFKMIVMILLVGVLGAGAIYLSKKVLPKFTNIPGKKIKVIETVHLGPRKSIHLIKIGNQQFLIGSTNENITKLADVAEEGSTQATLPAT